MSVSENLSKHAYYIANYIISVSKNSWKQAYSNIQYCPPGQQSNVLTIYDLIFYIPTYFFVWKWQAIQHDNCTFMQIQTTMNISVEDVDLLLGILVNFLATKVIAGWEQHARGNT